MNEQDKTKEKLIKKLQELQQKYDSLKEILDKNITERKQAEQEIEENREKYRGLSEAAFECIFLSEKGICIEQNLSAEKIFGYTTDEAIGRSGTEWIAPEYRQLVMNNMLAGYEQPYEALAIKKDGTTFPCILQGKMMHYKGKTVRVTSLSDITERKQADEALQESNQLLSLFVKHSPVYAYIKDVSPDESRVLIASDNIHELTGIARSDMVGKNMNELFPAKFAEKITRDDWEVVSADKILQFDEELNNRFYNTIKFPISLGGKKKLAGYTIDITERKKAEKLLNDIIDKNPMSIQMVDKEGFTLRVNPAYIELFGSFPPPTFSIFAELQSKNKALKKLVLLAKSGKVVNLPDVYFNTHDIVPDAPDNPLWIRALIFPLMDESGKPERFVFMHENITERKQAEQELIIAKVRAEESDRLKSAFLANMSHEIRTPMNGILGFAELLKEPGLTGEKQKEYIKIIEKSGARMLNIINDIVSISKIESGETDINISDANIYNQIDFVYNILKPDAESKGLSFSVNSKLPANRPTIKTDSAKLFAILSNLVKNAIKYTDVGEIVFGYDIKGEFLEFFVKDTGIGIPKNRQEAIFERFIQADIEDEMARQGAGLGLAISKAYVEMLGGKIWVESEPGKGSIFYFTIPEQIESKVKDDIKNVVTEESDINQIRKLNIVIAEDDKSSEIFLSIAVKSFSQKIIVTKTGTETIEICRNNQDIDLILMDIQMPEMSGYEATRQIRQFNKEVVIIAQTAYGLLGDREKALKAGCNDYIAKPINKAKLLALLQKYFQK